MSYTVDWSGFNKALRLHAAAETAKVYVLPKELPTQTAPTPAPEPLYAPPPIVADADTSQQFLRRAQGVALVILAAGVSISLALWAYQNFWSRPVIDPASSPFPAFLSAAASPAAAPSSVPDVVDYHRFTTRNLDGLGITTGWKWTNSRSTEPSYQYCYVSLDDPTGGAPRRPTIAQNGIQIPYNKFAMHPLTAEQYEQSIGACTWFKPNLG